MLLWQNISRQKRTAYENVAFEPQRISPVDIVAEEEVVCLRGEASILKQPQQVCVLPVDVACHGCRLKKTLSSRVSLI